MGAWSFVAPRFANVLGRQVCGLCSSQMAILDCCNDYSVHNQTATCLFRTQLLILFVWNPLVLTHLKIMQLLTIMKYRHDFLNFMSDTSLKKKYAVEYS